MISTVLMGHQANEKELETLITNLYRCVCNSQFNWLVFVPFRGVLLSRLF